MELTVYKASAGSGKTFTLASEYLRLALAKSNSQRGFRSILAVTFTNKATEEMKSRILTILDDLANGRQVELATVLAKRIGCSQSTLQQKALDVRSAILHDYSHFSIVTIDRFFQQILQAFIREAGLRPGYTVELDTDRLLEEAVAKVMDEAGNDKALHTWILRLAEDNIDAGKSWDVSSRLRAIGQEIFKESYLYFSKEYREKIADKSLLGKYINDIRLLIKDFEDKMKSIGTKAVNYIDSYGLSINDFKNKEKGVIGYFAKLKAGKDYEPTKRAYAALGTPEEWTTKTSEKRQEITSAFFELNNLLNEALNLWNSKGILYNTANVLYKNFMLFGLLSDISRNVQQIAADENILPISSSGYLLSQLIGNSDTPFIYEKTGVQYNHYMIDEFQDTSTGQWHNFRPLLLNSLAEGYINMVVGDVKQSIYRWRSGDWRILSHHLREDFSTWGIKEQDLNANWRSSGVIIRYNNELFSRFSKILQESINNELDTIAIPTEKKEQLQTIVTSAYSNIVQQFSPKTKIDSGYVSIKLIEDSEEQKSAEKVLEELPALIADIQDRGFKPSDIAILVRRGIEGQQVADRLLSYKQIAVDDKHCYDVVSQDSLFIANSSIVKLIMSIFRLSLNPADKISETFVHLELAKRQGIAILESNIHNVLSSGFSESDSHFIKSLSDVSLLDALELTIQRFQLNENTDDIPFLQELHDNILKFSSDKVSDLGSFLRWWDETGAQKIVLATNDKQNAIKILTIHKSKGLQFKVVIVPFCTWSLTPKNGSMLWLSPQVEPFNDMEHIPVSYSKNLANTIFYEDYYNEKAQSYVDNLNLLYVAFTRAEEELYAMVPLSSRKQEQSIASLLENLVRSFENTDSAEFGEIQGSINGSELSFGSKEIFLSNKKDEEMHDELTIQLYPSSPIHSKLKIQYESLAFFESEDKLAMTPQAYGVIMHRIFSNLRTSNDINESVDILMDAGLIEIDERAFYIQKIEKALSQPIAKEWFTDSWELKTEAEFLLPKQKKQRVSIRRPDRVMIKGNHVIIVDYKFGTLELPAYQRQLKLYMQGIEQMGYHSVKGYIWYVDTEKVTEISY